MKKIIILILMFSLMQPVFTRAAYSNKTECTIYLSNNTTDCKSDLISLVEDQANNQAVAKVSLNPENKYSTVKFDVYYQKDIIPSGWTVNIGDSATNNGYGGDGATQSNDAELQINGNVLGFYGNDYTKASETTDGNRHLKNVNLENLKAEKITFTISDGKVVYSGSNVKDSISNLSLFALNGQDDIEGLENYDIFASFNRVISGTSRNGNGVDKVKIKLVRSDSSSDSSDTNNNNHTTDACVKEARMNNSRCLRVISPNGGEIYKEGEKITVRWESNVFSYPVVIQILKLPKGTPGVPNKNSIETSLMPPVFSGEYAGTPNDGIEEVTLPDYEPNYFSSGKQEYYVSVVAIDPKRNGGYPLFGDFSDRKFTIVNKTNEVCSSNDPCLEIISPNNGEAYNVGDIVKIKWKTKNIRKDADTLLAIMDDRIPGWQANSLFGSSPALEYTEMTELSKDEYLYEYTFTVPENFNTSLPDKYQDVYGGKHYDAEVYVTFSGKSGTKSQKTIMDKSDKLFTINTKSASSLSEEQVSNLSKQSGLNISNICRNVSFPITEKTQIGSKGNSVSFLQLLLIQKKYLPHDLHTTYFGPRTKMALETFQKDSKIEVSGVVDKKTKDALQVLVSSYCSQAFGVTSKTQ